MNQYLTQIKVVNLSYMYIDTNWKVIQFKHQASRQGSKQKTYQV